MSFQQHGNGVDGKPDRIVSAIDLEVVSGRHEMLEFRAQLRRPRQQLDRLEACPLDQPGTLCFGRTRQKHGALRTRAPPKLNDAGSTPERPGDVLASTRVT